MSAAQATVTYKPIPGFPGYRAGDDGSVWSHWVGNRWKQRKPCRSGKYLAVNLATPGGRIVRRRVHHLILLAFVGPRPRGKECCHWDDNPHNNALVNLRWDTKKANYADRVRRGVDLRGIQNGRAKLTAARVRRIRTRYAAGGVSLDRLAEEHGMTRVGIRFVIIRRTWKHVP